MVSLVPVNPWCNVIDNTEKHLVFMHYVIIDAFVRYVTVCCFSNDIIIICSGRTPLKVRNTCQPLLLILVTHN